MTKMKKKIVSVFLLTNLFLFSLISVTLAAKAVPKDVSFLLGMY